MKRILVGLDGSFRARAVLKGAIAFAEQAHAKLILMRAVGLPADFPATAYAIPRATSHSFSSWARDKISNVSAGIFRRT